MKEKEVDSKTSFLRHDDGMTDADLFVLLFADDKDEWDTAVFSPPTSALWDKTRSF